MDTDIRLIVTGTGRSGTRYISKVLTRLGVKCGHENVFSIHGVQIPPEGMRADASWLAGPFLHQMNPEQITIAHQLRDPFKVIGSLVSVPGLLQKPLSAYGEFISRIFPLIWDKGYNLSLFERGACFFLSWSQMIAESRNFTWKVEDVHIPTLQLILGRIFEIDVSCEEVHAALEAVPKNTNHYRRRMDLSPAHLGRFEQEVVSFAEEYDYDI